MTALEYTPDPLESRRHASMRRGEDAATFVRAEVARSLEPYGEQDAASPIDTQTALADAITVAWYAADCPPAGTRESAVVVRIAVECFAAWHAWAWSVTAWE